MKLNIDILNRLQQSERYSTDELLTDFDWVAVLGDTEELSGEDLYSRLFELMLYFSGYIFHYSKEDIKRTDRAQVISAKTLAVFFTILGPKIGTTNAAAIRRASGINIQDQTLRYHIRKFKEYLKANKIPC